MAPQDLIASIKRHITNPDGYWGTSKFRMDTLAYPVVALHFVAHPNEANEGQGGVPPTNHWSLFLELDKGTSVRLEVVPNEPGCPGMVVIENSSCNVTEDLTHKVSAEAPPGTTVASVLAVIIDKKRDRYIFQPIGEGCRFWLFNLVPDLAEKGILPHAAAQEARAALPLYWPYPAGTAGVARTMTEGTFF